MPLLRLVPLAIAKTLSKLFGLATLTFFGRAPTRDNDQAGLIGLLSVTWYGVLLAVVFPPLVEAVFPLLPDDEAVQRTVAVATAAALGPVVGLLVGRLTNRQETGSALLGTAVRGWGYAAVIGGLVVALVVVVPAVKASHLLRRMQLQHLAIMIEPGRYDDVLDRVLTALRDAGIDAEVIQENAILAWLFRALLAVEARIFRRDIARAVRLLTADVDGSPVRIELHATDLAVRGHRPACSRVFGIAVDALDGEHVYFSWDDASQDLERRLQQARRDAADGLPVDDERLAAWRDELTRLELAPEQWGAIRRQLYRAEVETLRARAAPADASAAEAHPAGSG